MNNSVKLPEEIVTEILLKLPVKSIVKFKTVCKSWNSIINDTHFTKRHLKLALSEPNRNFLGLRNLGWKWNHIHPLHLYNQDADGAISAKKLDIPLGYGFYCLFNSCDGLLCFSDVFREQIFIWNPCLPTQVKIIPSQPFTFDEIAMGYDPKSDDYKIVKFHVRPFIEDDESDVRVEIFSFKSNRWKTMRFPLSHSFSYSRTRPLVYANNRVHWFAEGRYGGGNTSGGIIYFDLLEQSLKRMNLPQDGKYFSMLVSYKDTIAVAGDNLFPGFEYWVLKDYCGMKSSWNKILSLKFLDFSYYGSELINSFIGITLNGEICVQMQEGGVGIIGPKDGRLKDDIKGNTITPIKKRSCSIFPSPYIQSLLSPTQLH